MPRFVILLRGVNVGKGNRIPMAEFRRLLEESGFNEVRTLLNSGNAVVAGGRVGGMGVDGNEGGGGNSDSSSAHASAVHDLLKANLGLDVRVVVKSKAEFLVAVEGNSLTLPESDYSRCLVAFAQEPADVQDLAEMLPLLEPSERMVVGDVAAYLHCPDGIHESKAALALLGKKGRAITTRNWATVLKLKGLLLDDAN